MRSSLAATLVLAVLLGTGPCSAQTVTKSVGQDTWGLREEDPREAAEARRKLQGLDAVKSYLQIHQRIGGRQSGYFAGDLPYITTELAQKTIKEAEKRGIAQSELTHFERAWKVFPSVQVSEVVKSPTPYSVQLMVQPTGPIEARTVSDTVGALVDMKFERGYWRLNGVTPQKTSEWCAAASNLSPPRREAVCSIGGQRLAVHDSKETDGSVHFDLLPEKDSKIYVNFTAQEFQGLRARLQQERVSKLEFRHPSPLVNSAQPIPALNPRFMQVEYYNNGKTYRCTNGFGAHVVFENYRVSDDGGSELVDGSILLRLPDKDRSSIEGTFTMEWEIPGARGRRRR